MLTQEEANDYLRLFETNASGALLGLTFYEWLHVVYGHVDVWLGSEYIQEYYTYVKNVKSPLTFLAWMTFANTRTKAEYDAIYIPIIEGTSSRWENLIQIFNNYHNGTLNESKSSPEAPIRQEYVAPTSKIQAELDDIIESITSTERLLANVRDEEASDYNEKQERRLVLKLSMLEKSRDRRMATA